MVVMAVVVVVIVVVLVLLVFVVFVVFEVFSSVIWWLLCLWCFTVIPRRAELEEHHPPLHDHHARGFQLRRAVLHLGFTMSGNLDS